MNFCIQSGLRSREHIAICSYSKKLGYGWVVREQPYGNEIPIGSVEFCQQIFPKYNSRNYINFYPYFLKDWYKREIFFEIGEIKILESTFYKDACNWKSNIVAKVYSKGESLPYGKYWGSEVVNFIQEWRYYIANGTIYTTGWYDGNNEEEPAPELNIDWPKDFNAAVDFGRLDTGDIALVEAHAPFACGWYGDDHKNYVKWQYDAWTNYPKNTWCERF